MPCGAGTFYHIEREVCALCLLCCHSCSSAMWSGYLLPHRARGVRTVQCRGLSEPGGAVRMQAVSGRDDKRREGCDQCHSVCRYARETYRITHTNKLSRVIGGISCFSVSTLRSVGWSIRAFNSILGCWI